MTDFEPSERPAANRQNGPAVVCHLARAAEWEASVALDDHRPPSLAAAGFIHFSTIDQLVATAGRYYAGTTDLLVICADTAALSSDLRFERPTMANSPVADEFFPHLYRSFSPAEAILVTPFETDATGFVLPEALRSLDAQTADRP